MASFWDRLDELVTELAASALEKNGLHVHARLLREGKPIDVAAAKPRAARTRSPHQVLGVRAGATDEEIRARYLELARKHHPDVARTPAARARAEKRMAAINAAYAELRGKI